MGVEEGWVLNKQNMGKHLKFFADVIGHYLRFLLYIFVEESSAFLSNNLFDDLVTPW